MGVVFLVQNWLFLEPKAKVAPFQWPRQPDPPQKADYSLLTGI